MADVPSIIPASSSGGSPGSSNHATLTNLGWLVAGHTGDLITGIAGWEYVETPGDPPTFEEVPRVWTLSVTGAERAIPWGNASDTLDSSWIPVATATTLGGKKASKGIVGSRRFLFPGLSATSGAAYTTGTLYARPIIAEGGATISSVVAQVTSAAAAGQRARVDIYKQNASGEAGTVIWSGLLLIDAIAQVTLAISAGTWYDTAYQSGSNLVIPPGEGLWYGISFEGNASLIAANLGALAWSASASVFLRMSVAQAWATTPTTPAPAMVLATNAAPLVTFTEA